MSRRATAAGRGTVPALAAPALAALALAALAALAGCGSSAGSPAAATGRESAAPAGRAPVAAGPRSVERLVLPGRAPTRSVRVPILTYHRVHKFLTEYTKSIPDETVEPDVFAAEMAALARGGYHTISQTQLFHALFDGTRLPSKPVMITVDDGYVDDVQQILPVLLRLHMVATFYMVTRRFHEEGSVDKTQVRQLDARRIERQGHTTPAQRPAGRRPRRRDAAPGRRVRPRPAADTLGASCTSWPTPTAPPDPAMVAQIRRAGFDVADPSHQQQDDPLGASPPSPCPTSPWRPVTDPGRRDWPGSRSTGVTASG